MGEPLNNYKSVVEGIQIMTGRCFGLSPSHITVSTVRSPLLVSNPQLFSCVSLWWYLVRDAILVPELLLLSCG